MSDLASAPSTSSIGSTSRVVVEGLMHRGLLAGLELEEARAHVAVSGAVAAVAAVLALLAGFAGTFAIAASVWDRPDRGMILLALTLVYLLSAGALVWWLARRLKSWTPFADTRDQLIEDCTCLHDFLTENSR